MQFKYDNKTVICFSSSNYYVPYLLVCLKSLVKNASQAYNYDIIVFEHNITDENKKIILDFIKQKNISLSFYKIEASDFEHYYVYDQVSFETYFKISAPRLLNEYQKILFLDCDIIVLEDIQDLLTTDLHGKTIGAHYCTIWNGMISSNLEFYHYTTDFLELKNPQNYFQAGVMLIDVKKYINKNYEAKLIEFINNNELKCAEQCAFNYVCKEDVYYIDGKWNFETEQAEFRGFIPYISPKFIQERQQNRQSPGIVHYAGSQKPWFYPDEDFADIWWEYAKKTPFYEEIVKRYKEHKAKRKNEVKKELKLIKFKVRKYSLLSFFTFGKKHKYYHDKLVDNKRYLDYLLQENN